MSSGGWWEGGGLRNYGALWAGYRKQLEPFTPAKGLEPGIWNFQSVGIVWEFGGIGCVISLPFALCGSLLLNCVDAVYFIWWVLFVYLVMVKECFIWLLY